MNSHASDTPGPASDTPSNRQTGSPAIRDILVLLSTYNGEAFIAAQLESLRTQTLAGRIRLVIRDDGSTDATVGIVQKLDLAPLAVTLVSGTNLGPGQSFAALLSDIDGPYSAIFLCDQDDVWMPDKVEAAARTLATPPTDVPTLYAGRSIICDAKLTHSGITSDAPRGPSLRHALFQNIAPGHTMAFNLALARAFQRTLDPTTGALDPRVIMHDWWLYDLATALGTVTFDPTPHTYYRLHDHNEIGYDKTPVQRQLNRITRLFAEDRSQLTKQAEALMAWTGKQLAPADHAMLAAFLQQETLSSRLDYVRHYPIIAQHGLPAGSTLLFLVGRYQNQRK